MRHLADELAAIPGVVGVSLGGSRAAGTATATSDWDFGLYYRGSIDTDAIRRRGWSGQVFEPGDWGRIVNGGAWLQVEGERVDLIYRDVAEVERWTSEAEQGRFEIQREVGYVAGIATYVLTGELAVNETLVGAVPAGVPYPDALRASASSMWNRLAGGAVGAARAHATRRDRVAATANLGQAVLAAAQARLAADGQWVLNEKGIVDRAGLTDAHAVIEAGDLGVAVDEIARLVGATPA